MQKTEGKKIDVLKKVIIRNGIIGIVLFANLYLLIKASLIIQTMIRGDYGKLTHLMHLT